MNRRWIIQLIVFTIAMVSNDVQSQSLLQKIDAFRVPYAQFLIRTRLTVYNGKALHETAVFDAYINGDDKSLVVQKEGRNRDMKILYVNEKMWVQLPNARRPIRITPIQRLMGQASNGDVAMVSYGDGYTAEVESEVEVRGVPCEKVRLIARKASATYNRIMLYVRQSDKRPVKAEFYLVSGKHFKTAYYETYMRINDQDILQRMTIVDELRKEEKTTFEYELVEEKQIPVKYFNKNYLVHIQGL